MADDGAVISTELQLLGDSEYKKGLRDIGSQLALLNSDLKASQSAFRDLDSIEALQDKLNGLSKAYEKHREKVAFIAKQLDAAKQKYGENDARVMELQRSLNTATVAMNKCGNEIENTTDRINELTQADEDLTGAQDDLGESANRTRRELKDENKEAEDGEGKLKRLGQGALSAAGALAAITAAAAAAALAAIGAAAKEAAAALISCATGVATYADDILTLSIQTGVSAETLQKWTYASKFVDVEVSTITSSMTKMIRTMGSMDKNGVKSSDAMTKLGLTIYDTNGNLKDSEDMFMEVIYALGQVEDETERDALAMEIFGKSAQELNPLIEAGAQTLRELGQEAEDVGYVLSDEALAAAGSYQDSLDRMGLVWDGFKNNLGVIAVGLFQPFVDDATSMVSEVNKLLADGWQASDADALVKILDGALDKFIEDAKLLWNRLKPVVSALFTSLRTYISEELPQKVNNILPAIQEGVGDLTGGLKKLLTDIDWEGVGELLSTLLTSLVEVFTTLVTSLPDIIKGIDWTGIFDALLTCAESIVNAILECFGTDLPTVVEKVSDVVDDIEEYFTNLWTSVTTGVKSITEGIAGFFDDLWDTITQAFYDVVNGLISVYNTALGWAFGDIEYLTVDTDKAAEEGAAAGNAVAEGLESSAETVTAAATDLGENVTAGLAEGLKDRELLDAQMNTLIQAGILDKTKQDLGINSPSKVFEGYGENIVAGMALGIEDNEQTVRDAATTMVQALRNATQNAIGAQGAKFVNIGRQIAQGLASGLLSGKSIITDAAYEAAMAAYYTSKNALGIHSPSTLFEYLGEMSAKGFAIGIDNMLTGGLSQLTAGGAASLIGGESAIIDYEKLGNAVASALRNEGVGEAVVVMDGQEVGRLTEAGVSRESYLRTTQSVKGRAAAMII